MWPVLPECLRDLAQVASDDSQFCRGRHAVVMVPGIQVRREGVPLSLFSMIKSETADERDELPQHWCLGIDVSNRAGCTRLNTPGSDDLLRKAFCCRTLASARGPCGRALLVR